MHRLDGTVPSMDQAARRATVWGLSGTGEQPDMGQLTERERELLALMARGLSNTAISDRLCLSGKTVECHVRNIFQKLGLLPAEHQHRRVLAVLAYLRAQSADGPGMRVAA